MVMMVLSKSKLKKIVIFILIVAFIIGGIAYILKNRTQDTMNLLDMASDEEDSWKSILEKEGFKVNIHLQGLGEYPAIQDKFVNHALDCAKELEKELA